MSQKPLHQASAAELKARIEEERIGVPFVVFREPSGEQRILSLGGRDTMIVGRAADVDLPLPWDEEVSRVHAELRCVGRRWVVSDDGLSRNGTFVNGERVLGRQPLDDGDQLRVGRTAIAFWQREGAEHDAATRAAEGREGAPVPITVAQRRVLVALCRPCREGHGFASPATNQQIADELFLSVPAVKTHLRALFQRLEIDRRPATEREAAAPRRAGPERGVRDAARHARGMSAGFVEGRRVAAGGMGSIHAGRAADGRPVAIKRLLDDRHEARFAIEARLLQRLDHPRVVRFLDSGTDDRGHFLVMEWVDGEDLAARLKREGKPGLPPRDVLSWAVQAGEALRYVHEQQLVHRDVKPQNLMLAPDRGIVLVDFGVARELTAEEGTRDIGTPGFMAPEAVAGGRLTSRADVYGLSAALWAMLTGRPPTLGRADGAEGIPSAVVRALQAGLEIDPRQRLESIDALVAGLGGRLAGPAGRGLERSAPGDAAAGVLEAIVRTAAGVFDAAATSVALVAADGALDYRAAWGTGADQVVGTRLAAGHGIGGRVAASGQAEVVPDCRRDRDFAEAVAARTGYIPNTLLAAPLMSGGRSIGVLTILDRKDGGAYGVDDLQRAALFADLVVAALASQAAGAGAAEETQAAAR